MKLALLLILALPAYAQAPSTPPILISGEEREAIIERMGLMASHIEKLEKALNNCRQAQRT